MAKKPTNVSIDEFLSNRKDFVGSNGAVTKATKAPASWDSVNRSARFVMSTEAPDRDKDIIIQSGMNLTEFLKNPQALMFHNSWSFPIGSWEDVQTITAGRPKRTEGTLKFVPAGKDAQADLAAFHVENGSLRAVSIGFIPKAVRRREEDPVGGWPGYEILESELVECSLVPIPANPGALVKGAGRDLKASRDLIEEILDTWIKLPTGLIAPRKDYEAALAGITGFKTTAQAPCASKEDGDEDADNTGTPGARDDDEDDNPPRTADEEKSGDTDGDAETSDDEPDEDDGKKGVRVTVVNHTDADVTIVKRIKDAVEASVSTILKGINFGSRAKAPEPPKPADPDLLAQAKARFEAVQKASESRLI